MADKVVLDSEDIRRTLVRIAHEIVERTAVRPRHRRHPPPRRGARRRLHELVSELVEPPVPLGDIDISFYRDDLGARRRRRSRWCTPRTSTSPSRAPRSCWWTTCSTPAARSAPRSTRCSTTAARDRVQLAVLADRGHRELPIRPDYVGKNLPTARAERVNVRVEEIDGVDEVTHRRARWRCACIKNLISIEDLTREDIERILDRAESFAEVSGREIKKVPTLRGRTVINLFYEASTRTSSSFELAAKRLSADLVNIKSVGSCGGQGRVAQGHDPDALGLRPGRDRHPLARTRAPPSWWPAGPPPRSSTRATASTSTRPRRCSTSTRCGAGVGSLDGLKIWIVGDVLHSRVARSNILAFTADGRRGDGLRAADADPARGRVARLRGALHARRARGGGRGLRPADAERAHDAAPSCRRCASTPPATRSTAAGSGRTSC